MDQMLLKKTNCTPPRLLCEIDMWWLGLSCIQYSFAWPKAPACNLHDLLVVIA